MEIFTALGVKDPAKEVGAALIQREPREHRRYGEFTRGIFLLKDGRWIALPPGTSLKQYREMLLVAGLPDQVTDNPLDTWLFSRSGPWEYLAGTTHHLRARTMPTLDKVTQTLRDFDTFVGKYDEAREEKEIQLEPLPSKTARLERCVVVNTA